MTTLMVLLTEQLSSETVVALSMGQLLSVVLVLASIIGGVIAFVRKDEHDKGRLLQNEKDISELTKQVKRLTEQVERLTGALIAPTKRRVRPSSDDYV